jgi:excisionase family DNA binding protein
MAPGEAARYLGITMSTLYGLVTAGQVVAYKRGACCATG